MGEKEKVLVQDKPGRLAQTARGFSISLALASGRVSVGGAQGGGGGVGLDLHGFDWYDTSCNGALAGRIDIT